MAYPSLRRFRYDHLPLLCWFVAAASVTVLATVIEHLIDDPIIGVFFLIVPLLAIAWLAAAASELSRAMGCQYDGFGATMTLLSGTLMLSILGPFATIWLAVATDRAMSWIGTTAKLVS
jgi:hypothetical protein